MKFLIITSLFLLSLAVLAHPRQPIEDVNLAEVQETSFYTGCIDGWIVAYEQGWYVRPENMTGKQVFKQLKVECTKKAKIYRKEMGN